jgi:D-arabinose 1-dehydrogenase-like Zn-dependent alcohol dehydrogenase
MRRQLTRRDGRFLEFMAPFSHIILLGFTPEPLNMPFLPIMLKEISIHGALTSKSHEFDAMLEFASTNGIIPTIEEFPMTENGAAAAIARLRDGSIRYRAVLVSQAQQMAAQVSNPTTGSLVHSR